VSPDLPTAHRNQLAFNATMARLAGGTVEEHDGAVVYAVDAAPPMLSGVLPHDPAADPVPLVELGARELTGRPWSVGRPGAEPAGALGGAAARAGLEWAGSAPAMWLDGDVPQTAVPAGITVSEGLPADGWTGFWAVAEEAYAATGFAGPLRRLLTRPHPPGLDRELHPVVATDADGRAVGIALTLDSDDVAGLYWVGVRPSARRSGLGTVCSTVAVRAARARGARAVVLQASPDGEPIYRRLGFREFARYGLWLSGG
jgi:GNAT superfamily N-acetyltransferase